MNAREKNPTRWPALGAFAVIVATFVALIVMLTLQIAGVAAFHPATWIAVIFGGALAVVIVAGIAARGPKGRARNLTDHPIPTRLYTTRFTNHDKENQ